ncbi:YycH family regulatory protein [Planococcus sp. X10-3]|uniref:YycH family regulatory protein n=1 Tax=Planococcus sp. X10-3 TaxID=3061240 RepID=UPI003BAF64EE
MKYIEQIKSIVLFLLVSLSIGLTFIIWNFTPSTLVAIEPSPAIDIDVGETKKIEQIVQPTKILYHNEATVNGTVNKDEIDLFLSLMRQQWEISDLSLQTDEATAEEMTEIMHAPSRAVLYYPGNVPFPVFDTLMEISDTNVPEATFNRMVVNWESAANGELVIHFVNSESGRIYQGTVQINDFASFEESIINPAEQYPLYITDESIGMLPIYVPADTMDTSSYVYLYEETPLEEYARGLFAGSVEPARNLIDGGYTDNTGAFLEKESALKSLNYVQSKAETADPAIPSELVFNTIGFINDHGGWTNEYRYFGMEPISQEIEYRLFINNLPVFGSSISTAMDVQWGMAGGEEQVFRYDRPIYVLEPTGRTIDKDLASGTTVLAALSRLEEEEKAAVTDVIPGYELVRNSNDVDRLMLVEPTWYFKTDGIWLKLSNEVLGGGPFGLE